MLGNLFLTKYYLFSGEGKDVTEEMTNPWKETILQTTQSNYVETNIYNTGEVGLFYRSLPKKLSI